MQRVLLTCALLLPVILASAQQSIKGKIFDSITKEALQGASVSDAGHHTVISDASGRFLLLTTDSVISISCNSYISRRINISGQSSVAVSLTPSGKDLQQVVVSASRTAQKRS